MCHACADGSLSSSIALVACCVVSAASAQTPATRPAADRWARHYEERVARFRQENAAARNIVFVGSSHVEGFDFDKYLPGRRILNRGISSDHIGVDGRGVLGRLEESVFDCNPGFVLLENGVNDLGDLWRTGKPSLDEIEAAYRKVVDQIRARRPDVPLVIVGLFPTRDRYAGLQPLIVEFNRRLVRIAADAKCPFMDVYKPFADDEGLLRKDYSRDGLHLSDAGYRQWAELVEKALPPSDGTRHTTTRPASDR